MVAVQPTRGLDVGAIEAVETLLLEQREQRVRAFCSYLKSWKSCLALSDRIAVIYGGQIMGSSTRRGGHRRDRPDDDGDAAVVAARAEPVAEVENGMTHPLARPEPTPYFPYRLQWKNAVEEVPRWLPALTSLGAVVVAFLISGLILKMIGGEPLRVLRFFYERHSAVGPLSLIRWLRRRRSFSSVSPVRSRSACACGTLGRRAVLHGRLLRQPGCPYPLVPPESPKW
jgi:hypothetical protein